MNLTLACFAKSQVDLLRILELSTLEGQIIIAVLLIFSVFAWSVMASKALEMRRARRLNGFFDQEFRRQPKVMGIFERKIEAEGCPLFSVYRAGCQELEARLRKPAAPATRVRITLNSMEHVKRALERAVAQEALRLESGLILLAIAVSGAPFLGLLGTVWGVMSAFSYVAMQGKADLQTMAPGVAGALITTVAGLLVAIPSMFGYNWLVHTLRVLTVELDNFAQELVSRMETEYLDDDRDPEPDRSVTGAQ